MRSTLLVFVASTVIVYCTVCVCVCTTYLQTPTKRCVYQHIFDPLWHVVAPAKPV